MARTTAWKNPQLLVIAAAGLLVGVGVGVALPIAAYEDPPVLAPLEQTTANNAAATPTEATMPASAPPYLTTFAYALGENDQREVRFQQHDINVVICDYKPGVSNSTCEGENTELLRSEDHGDRVTKVVLAAPVDHPERLDEWLSDEDLGFVRAYWESVPLVKDHTPEWVADLAALAN